MTMHRYGVPESHGKCQIVAVYSISNPKRKMDIEERVIRIVTDYGKGLYNPNCKPGGIIKNKWIVVDNTVYSILQSSSLKTKHRAFYVIKSSEKSPLRIFRDTMTKVLESEEKNDA